MTLKMELFESNFLLFQSKRETFSPTLDFLSNPCNILSNWMSKKTFFKQSLIIRIDVNNKYPIKSNWMRASYWRDRRLGAINVVVVTACHNKSRNETFNKKYLYCRVRISRIIFHTMEIPAVFLFLFHRI